MNDRVKQLRKSLKLSQENFGEILGVGKTAVSKWERGAVMLPEYTIKLICKEFNVDYIWLTTGKGEMFHQSEDEIEDIVEKVMYGENEFYKNLFKTFAKLGDAELEALEKIIDTYNEVSKNEKEKS